MRFLLLIIVLAWHSSALADDMAEAQAAYATGDYARAETIARDLTGAGAHVLAAEAIQTALILNGANARDARKARRHAEAALKIDPDNVDALIQLALAHGLEARASASSLSYFRGSARKGRDALDRALVLDPDNVEARAISGAWHLEILLRAGAAGQRLYGADLENGITDFEAAMALGDQPMTGAQFALLLLALDAEAHAPRARAALDWALTQPPRTHFDTAGVERAKALLDAIDDAGRRDALIADWLD